MRILLQRVSRASVTVDGQVVGEIGPGLLLLVGVAGGDDEDDAEFLANKIANLRIFSDDEGRMNLSLLETTRQALVVSQFTLLANVRKGRRPSFVDAAAPSDAEAMVDQFSDLLEDMGIRVATGRFGAMMEVELVNDGPVTIWLDTSELRS